MVCLLLLLGLATTFITRMILLKLLKTEFQHKGVAIARSLAANSLVDVLTHNTSRLKKLVEDEKSLDSDIAYIFIIDSSKRILAHTFNKGFPIELAKVNNVEGNGTFNIQPLDTQMGLIYDIAVPVHSEKNLLGQARLGILQNSVQSTIARINIVFISTTLLIMAIGILLSYRVSSLITKPISRLVEATQSVHKGNFDIRLDGNAKDEIGILTQTFNEMVAHLKEQIEEIKRLATVEERSRIAVELHDSLAQNLIHLITGLEFCEKLFQKDPRRTYNEIGQLKENSRHLLGEAREVIYDLKKDETQDGYVWLNQISDFINDFQKKKKKYIPVKSDISASIPRISLTKARMLFYIIREAFNNIDRHSQANNVEVALTSNPGDNLNITIKDDGIGFDVEKTLETYLASGKFGLAGMRQRVSTIGGELFIDSKLGEGTKIFIRIPLEKD